jgi:MoaA/NifB/PqqE/SkfB family radical SAM enzyme
VPTEEMFNRIDHLAALGTTIIHLSGGEPLLHPEAEGIIRRIRQHGILAGILTNGYLLGPERIRKLNEAGLDHLQISVDNLEPDRVSMKSWKVLKRKLEALSESADFEVNINSVVGNDLQNPEEALIIARLAVGMGFSSTVGILHDQNGQLRPLEGKYLEVYEAINQLGKPLFSPSSHNSFQKNMVRGLPTEWHCHAGCRYLYICEDGLVHYCSQQRGTPGVPLQDYSAEHLEREYNTIKGCAPFCTVSCVHRIAWLDKLRENPRAALEEFFPPNADQWSTADLPMPVRLLTWLFMSGSDGKPTLASRFVRRLMSSDR